MKKGLAIGIILLFLVSSGIPQTIMSTKNIMGMDLKIDVNENQSTYYRLLFPHYRSNHNLSHYIDKFSREQDRITDGEIERNGRGTTVQSISPSSKGGVLDSPWPMYCHDVNHTGQSPFSTRNTTSIEKWRYLITKAGAYGSPVIGEDGTMYVGADTGYFYAFFPNGSVKWSYNFNYKGFSSAAAIDENGTIYVGTIFGMGDNIYAFYPNGTLKWAKGYGGSYSSPAIGKDGTIYDGSKDGKIYALNPNGTVKWIFSPEEFMFTSPAIAVDGTIYCTFFDGYLYALYPNGTVKWKYLTSPGEWIHGSPTIAQDGTIYFGADNNMLYAINPNGTLKWMTSIGPMGISPALDKNGIIYAAVDGRYVYAVYPNGTIKWSFDIGPNNWVWGSSIAISQDGYLYFGTQQGDIFALDSNGTEQWRKQLPSKWIWSSPCIGSDGTVYICSSFDKRTGPGNHWISCGYIHAFGPIDSNQPPTSPQIVAGTANGTVNTIYDYWFLATDPDKNPIRLYIDWGDGTVYTYEGGEYASGETVTIAKSWVEKGTYQIRMKTKDSLGVESNWSNPYIVNIEGPSIRILEVKGGWGVSVVAKNTEMFDLTNTNWSINFSNCLMVLPLHKSKTGTISTFGANSTTTIDVFVLGLGIATISVIVGDASASNRAIVIGPFTRIKV
jgi:outer membrane protein assembly factor BamB